MNKATAGKRVANTVTATATYAPPIRADRDKAARAGHDAAPNPTPVMAMPIGETAPPIECRASPGVRQRCLPAAKQAHQREHREKTPRNGWRERHGGDGKRKERNPRQV